MRPRAELPSRRWRFRQASVLLMAALLAVPGCTEAQGEPGARRRTLHALLGSYVPLGALREGFGPTMLVGLQGNRQVGANTGVVASLTGAQVRDTRQRSRPEWYLWQYDVGIEMGGGHGGRLAHPALFGGMGVGGRTYNRAGPERGVRSAVTAYASAGAEARAGRTGVRVETRLYASRPGGQPDGRAMRADLALSAGLAYHFR
jgi:hypothetical protein